MPVEIIVPDHIASFVLQTFGRLATPRTYDLEKLRTLCDQMTTLRTERLRIQGDATLAGLLASTETFPDRWSVIEVQPGARPSQGTPLVAQCRACSADAPY
jgi:hypothetical protein